jgi:hypothetical protein
MKALAWVISWLVLTGLLAAQPSLRITSPADGTLAHPGESVTVTVAASPPDAFSAIFVTGPDPIPYGQLVSRSAAVSVHDSNTRAHPSEGVLS